MIDLSFIWQLALAGFAILSSYFMIKNKVSQHDEKFVESEKKYKEDFETVDHKVDKCFSKYDDLNKTVSMIERELEKKASLKEVAEEYVSRRELELTLQKIELVTTSTNKEVAKIDKQMEEIIHILQEIRSK